MKKIQIGAIFTAMRESFADKKKRAGAVYRILSKTYPDVKCELDFKNPLQLLVATVLSAQCTDKRVNAVTPALFKKYKSVKAFAGADMRELQNLIKSTGFFRAKAKSIKGLATGKCSSWPRLSYPRSYCRHPLWKIGKEIWLDKRNRSRQS